jgi:hypothetical protein
MALFRLSPQGKVKEFSNQYIETDFLLIFPGQSYFVQKKPYKRIQIPLFRKSLNSFYLPILIFFLAVSLFGAFIFFGNNEIFQNSIFKYIPTLIIVGGIAASLFFAFKKDHISNKEKKQRTIFEEAFGLNAMPSWFHESEKIAFAKIISEKLPVNWMDKIEQNNFTTEEFYILYTYLSYKRTIEKNEIIEKFFSKLDQRIKE